MTTKYRFQLSRRETTSYPSSMKEKLSVRILEDGANLTNFVLSLKLSEERERLKINDINLKVGVAWQDMETMAYLKGRFFFNDEREINKAVAELKNGLNTNDFSIEGFHERWQAFHLEFCEWFDAKLKPCLNQEVRLYQSYLALND